VGKRSDFTPRPQDKYYTPKAGIIPLLPFLPSSVRFSEPCAGDGRLIRHLVEYGHYCVWGSDILPDNTDNVWQADALDLSYASRICQGDMIISNPPWSRPILHQLIEYLPTLRPTWLLFDADWPHTRQSRDLIKTCSKIVSIGRLKWIEGSKSVGKDNCCWYFFPGDHTDGPHFYGRT
jgi:hypothetical protein